MSENENEQEQENYLLRKQDIRLFFVDLIDYMNKPSISPLMIMTLIGIIIFTITINSILFAALALLSLVISILLYLPIMLIKAKHKSGLMVLVGRVIDILSKVDEADDQKVAEMENAVMLTMHEINKYYEKKLKAFTAYLRQKKEVKVNGG